MAQDTRHENVKLTLTAEQSNKFILAFKIGVLKQLHSKKLLSDTQLNQLISLVK